MAAALEIGAAAKPSSVVIFDNLSGSPIGDGPVYAGFSYAESFTTGAQSDMLASVTLALSDGTADGSFAVNLYDASGSGSSPGVQLLTLAGSDNPGSGNIIYTGSLALSPNTTYWVEAEVNPSSDSYYEWSATEDAPAVGSNIGLANSGMDGDTWQVYSGVDLQMEVNVTPTAVPEPASTALLAVGALGLLLRRHRRV